MPYPSSIIFIGDSITANMTLSRYLSGAVNKGVAGNTTSQMAARYGADVIAHAPDVVVILGGTNNIIGSPVGPSADDLEWMAQQAKNNDIVPVLCTIPPIFARDSDGVMIPVARICAFNAAIKALAATKGVPCCDFYSVLALHGGYPNPLFIDAMPDTIPPYRVHPSPAGYDAMFHVLSPILLTI